MTRVTETEMESLSPPVLWRGLSAVYSPDERQIMAALPVPEQFSLHVLKSLTDGEIREGGTPCVTVSTTAPAEAKYVHEDEIVFGEDSPATPTKRPKKIYALVWTFQKHRVYKTKTIASRKMRVWKLWKERQGWKVTRLGDAYMAVKGLEKEAISLHEYDRDTKERLK